MNLDYHNPLRYTDGTVPTNPDPFGFKHRGVYYCYSTGERGVNVSVSDDLVAWTHHGYAFEVEGHRDFWAPSVIYHDGQFYMYVSTAPADTVDPHEERLRLAVADDPLGPFRLVTTLFDRFSIDAHVVRDEDGEFYLFYSTNDVTGLDDHGAGTAILVDRLLAFDRPAGNPTPVVVPTLPQEVFETDRFGDGRDWYTIEGATYFAHRDTAYLTYSGNAYVREDYFIGFAKAARDGKIGDLRWRKFPSDYDHSPLVCRSNRVEGTGHNSVVVGPDLVQPWVLYHARQADEPLLPDQEQRTMRIDPLHFDGDRLVVDAPSAETRPAPAQPRMRDLFRGPRLGEEWVVESGFFVTGKDCAATREDQARSFALSRGTFGSYRAEIYLSAVPSHAGARFGVTPVYLGEHDRVDVVIDVAARRISATRRVHNFTIELASAPLPSMNVRAFHHLVVDRIFDELTIALDGVVLLSCNAPEGASRFGILSVRTAAQFSGLSVTDHLDLYGPRMRHLPRLFEASAETALGRSGVRGGASATELIGKPLLAGWRYALDFAFLGARSGLIRYFPSYQDKNEHVLVEMSQAGLVKVVQVRAGVADVIEQRSFERETFTVEWAQDRRGTTLRVDGVDYALPKTLDNTSQRILLTAAELRGIAATRPAENS